MISFRLAIAAGAAAGIGVGLLLTSSIVYRRIAEPARVTIAELRQDGQSPVKRIVTVAGRPDNAAKVFNVIQHSDVERESPLLSPVSPRDGVPLVGPNAVPEDQWPALHGAYVAAQLKGESRLFIQEQTDFRGLKLTSRVILARLSHPTLWALSRDHFSGLQTLPFGQSRALSDEEKAWLSADEFKGRLYFLSGFSSGGLDGAKIKQLYSQAGGQASDLDTAWLIVEIERNAVPVFGGGWNVYAPFTDSDAQLWLQWPLPDAQSRLEDNGSVTMLPDDVDLSQLKPEFEGVWLAPGSHHFAPPGAAPGTVGLLIADPEAIAALVAERWSVHWGRIAQSAGYAFLALAALIVLVGLVHKRYFKSGIPDFLTPYAGYILPTSPWVQFGRISAGTLALVIALAGFVAHMLIRDNIRFNRTPFSEATLEVADLLAIPGTWLAFYLAMSFLARSGLTVMRNDSRPPILYLRSFRADPSFWASSGSAERQLVRAVRSLGPVVAIGAPGTTVPPLGAARMSVAHEHWQDVVKELVEHAQLVLLRIGRSEGFWWEVKHLVSTADPRKVLVFLPKEDRGAVYREFSEYANKVLPSPLPADPKAAGFLAFSSDWTPRLVAARGPSAGARWRRWLGGGKAPAISEALREVTAIKPMRLSIREWGTIVFALLLVAQMLGGLARSFH